MTGSDDEKTDPGRRLWQKDDRAKISIMQVFRSAYFEHDARKGRSQTPEGEVEITRRSRQRRDGISETHLRAHLEADLNALLNTIRLDAAQPLDDAPHIKRSILNYGFRDLSSVSASELNTPQMINSIRQSLIDYEPRLLPDTIEVRILDYENNASQRLLIAISAEMIGDPIDLRLDFDAEVDLGAGKLRMSKLRVKT